MHYASQLYRGLLNGMAVVAALTLVWLMVAVVLSVLMRNFGLQPWSWLFVSTEYGMFYLTLLGAPWLVREKGHVHIELLTAALPPTMLQVVSRLVALLCVLACAVLAWKGFDLVMTQIERGSTDTRGGYFIPRWILTSAYPICFGLMAIEFFRFVVGRDLLHSGQAGIAE